MGATHLCIQIIAPETLFLGLSSFSAKIFLTLTKSFIRIFSLNYNMKLYVSNSTYGYLLVLQHQI